MSDKKTGLIEEVVRDITEDPDAPERGDAATPPQTIANEPEADQPDRSKAPR